MRTRIVALSVLIFLLTATLALPLHRTQARTSIGPLDISGELHGAPYRIVVPEPWNGTLLVHVHGYRDKADHPGEVDNREAEISPNPVLSAALLAQGYALAG